MPDEAALVSGPLRDLTWMVHQLYRAAGRPATREIARRIAANPALGGTASHESVRAVLNGRPTRWDMLQAVGYQLAQMAHPPQDPVPIVENLLRHWNEAQRADGDESEIARSARRGQTRAPEEVKEILNELDGVLEADPEQFVRNFVQAQGGGDAEEPRAFLKRFDKIIPLLGSQLNRQPSAPELAELIVALLVLFESSLSEGIPQPYELIHNTDPTGSEYQEIARLAAEETLKRNHEFPLDRFFSELYDDGDIRAAFDYYLPTSRLYFSSFFDHLLTRGPVNHVYFRAILDILRAESRNWIEERRRRKSRQTQSMQFEAALRQLIENRDFVEARHRFAQLEIVNQARADQLRKELGFLWLDDSDRNVAAGLWRRLATGHPARAKVKNVPLPPGVVLPLELVMFPAQATPPPRTATEPTPAQAAAPVSPPSTVRKFDPNDVLLRLFEMPSTSARTLAGRPMRVSVQQQAPWEFDGTPTGSPDAPCRVLVYPGNDPITMAAVAPEIMRREALLGDDDIEYLVIVSLHGEIDEELRRLAQGWNKHGKFQFLVWLFGASDLRAAATHPEILLQNLRHRPRVPEPWRRYLESPALLAFPGEDHATLNAKYHRPLPIRFADDRGAPLQGNAIEYATAWLASDKQGLVVTGDFGDGKTFFTYNIARRLCEASKSAVPGKECIPLRLALRDLPAAGNARELLSRRLGDLGLHIADWQDLVNSHPTLVILDGFDEMSNDMSRESLLRNIKLLRECYQMFTSSKILLTSRRAFGSQADQKRLFDRIGNPDIVRLLPLDRPKVIASLLELAQDATQQAKVRRLQSLHDPIELATKPLYHAMIAETLPQLPSDDFTEETLYETYVRNTILRKIEFLEDYTLNVDPDDLVGNLESILERVASELHRTNAPYLYLKTLDLSGLVPNNRSAGLAQVLWDIREGGERTSGINSEEDATARVGVRSLLKGHPDGDADQWPVDFSHRSMREYFVARSVASAVASPIAGKTTAQHAARPPTLLKEARLPPEILRFTALILLSAAPARAADQLEHWARSITMDDDPSPLGANALSLLFAYTGSVPGTNWAGLRLDYAQLAGADLQGRSFRGSSLRHANLDNVNLTDADLRKADLSGVRLEETSSVTAVAAADREDVIYAAYGDLSLREWNVKTAHASNRVLHILPHRVDRLWLTPRGRLGAVGESTFTLLSDTDGTWTPTVSFRLQSRYRPPDFSGQMALLADEGTRTEQLLWLDPVSDTATVADLPGVRAWAVHGKDGFAAAMSSDMVVVRLNDVQVEWGEELVAAVALRITSNGEVLLALGRQDGTVRLIKLLRTATGMQRNEVWTRQPHTGPVTALAFVDDARLVSGGADRALCVIPAAEVLESGDGGYTRFELTLRCRNVRIDGLRGDLEQNLLRRLSSRQ
jgi:ubiquitin-like protein Pup